MADTEWENCSCSDLELLPAVDYLRKLNTLYLTVTIVCVVLVAAITVIFIIELHFIYRRHQTWPQPLKTIWLLALYPVMGWCTLTALAVPRSGEIGGRAIHMYFAITLYIFKQLIAEYYGNRNRMIERQKHSKYVLQSMPCCCCCPCLPMVPVSKRSSLIVELLLIQFVLISPTMAFINAVFQADAYEPIKEVAMVTIPILDFISSLFALYGMFLFYGASVQHLKYAGIKAKFICLKLILTISMLQEIILAILSHTEVIQCSCHDNMDRHHSAKRIAHIVLIAEVFPISLLAMYFYKQDQMLHLHPDHTGFHTETLNDQVVVLTGPGLAFTQELQDGVHLVEHDELPGGGEGNGRHSVTRDD